MTAPDGNEALDLYSSEESIDLVITDMAMPNMDGPATIRAIRKINPKQKIIAVSGLVSGYHDEGDDLTVDRFLTKPFTSKRLLTSTADVLADDSKTGN